MKKLLLSTVALVGFAGVASAADLPRRVVAPVAPFVPAFTWTGFYFGVNAGAGFDVNNDDDDDFFGNGSDRFGSDSIRFNRGDIRGSQRTAGRLQLRGGSGGGDGLFNDDDDSDVGFAGGGQVGFNYQFTPGSGIVVGLEADIQYIDIGGGGGNGGGGGRSTTDFAFTADQPQFGLPPAGPTNSFGAAFDPRGPTADGRGPATRVVRGSNGRSASSLDYFGTVRGRVGYAFDRTLIYATGGFAYGGGETENNGGDFFDNNNGVFDNGNDDDFRYGYTVGGGVEFAFSNLQLFGSSTMTFKIEGLYVNLGEDDNNNNVRNVNRPTYSRITRTLRLPSANGGGSNESETEFAVVRAGVNFKF